MKDNFITKVRVYGLEESVEASKYPMAVNVEDVTSEITDRTGKLFTAENGSGHDHALDGIIVQFNLKATNKFWVEAERYHWFDFVSSQSTMHRIAKFDLDKAYINYVSPVMIEEMKRLVDEYNIYTTNGMKEEAKESYLKVLYSNPAGFMLTARMTTNYLQLKTIYAQRRNHRLPEWQWFCDWVETLPHSEWITRKIGETK